MKKVIVFFPSVSHQLYGNSNSHLTIRSLGVRYLKDNPERFIESIVGCLGHDI